MKNNLIAKVFYTVFGLYYRSIGYYPININSHIFKCDPYHIAFWRRVNRNRWEPNTFKILSRFLNNDSIYCDVGAWIGPTVIYAAKQCKEVICFEPDPIAYRYLIWNIELNELNNVKPFNVALADFNGITQMTSFGGNLGDSMTSILNRNSNAKGIDVITMTWNNFLDCSDIHKIDFLKIDIEGGEFTLLPSIKDYLYRYKPLVYLSTHAPFLDNNKRKKSMQMIAEIMCIYNNCYDESLTKIDFSSLDCDESQNECRSYIFTD